MGLLRSVGKIFNDLTGATSASEQSQRYALESAKINNAYQKEFAQNAHQWEVEDLKKSGLNPILSAGGSGTSASGGGVASATETSTGLSPIDALTAGINAYTGIQNAKQIKANTDNINADTLLKEAKTKSQLLETAIRSKASPQIIKKFQADLDLTEEQINKLGYGKVADYIGTKGTKEAKDLLEEFVGIWQRNKAKYKENHPEYNGI